MSRTYEQLEPVISALDDRIKTNLGAFPTDTAEGSIASFPDGADDIPLKSLVVNIDPVQSGSGDPSPDNVRPISGWSEVNVQRTGVNLWDGLNYTSGKYLTDTGDTNTNIPYGYTDYIPVAPDSTYYVGGISGANQSICWYDNDKNFIGGEKNNNATSKTISVPSNAHFIRVSFLLDNVDTLMVNYPSTDHDYHPYDGQSINIALGQTVYGGKLDVVSGVLTVDYKHLLLDGSETWNLQSINSHGIANFATSIPSYTTPVDLICNRLPLQTSIIAETTTEGVMPAGNTNIYIRINSSRASTVAEFKQWLASNNVEVVYKIRTPLTIQLTPHEVTALLGSNNVWADSGNSEVVYRADPTLYIQRLTEPDADMVADANITSGQYFMVGNTLYKATANIASGSAVIVGTNATRKSLSEALNEINS